MKYSFSSFFAAVAAVLGLFLCCTCDASDTFTLTGRVVDGAGRGVGGAEIFVYDSATIRRPADFISARTGKDGFFSLSLPRRKYWAVARVRTGDKFGPLLPGDRHSGEPVEVEPEGNSTVKREFAVADIREAAQSRQKDREGLVRLSGRIIGTNGRPVKNAYVFAGGADRHDAIPSYISRWSDQSGEYTLFLPPGKYVVKGALQFPPEHKGEATPEQVVEVGHTGATADVKVSVTGEVTESGGHETEQEE